MAADLSKLSMAQIMGFLVNKYSHEALKKALRELTELGRYGDWLTIERQEELGTFSQLTEMGLESVVRTMRSALPHQWMVKCPYDFEGGSKKFQAEWKEEVEAKRKAFYGKKSAPGV